jgi:hypothetical protein
MALLVAAAGFFGLGYYAGGELVPDEAGRPAGTIRSEQPAVSADRARKAPTLQIRERESAPAAAAYETAPTVRRVAPSSGGDARRSAAPSDIADPTVTAPAGSPTTQTPPAAVVRNDPRRDPARATVRGTIEKPTEEQRNSESTPADPRK